MLAEHDDTSRTLGKKIYEFSGHTSNPSNWRLNPKQQDKQLNINTDFQQTKQISTHSKIP
jgi:hypothetical protein